MRVQPFSPTVGCCVCVCGFFCVLDAFLCQVRAT
uniref:Uncharacterized protein n=1 Tax=Anopheles arabiensis TaxID=7173 RepID=A0A182IGY4_ANOAR